MAKWMWTSSRFSKYGHNIRKVSGIREGVFTVVANKQVFASSGGHLHRRATHQQVATTFMTC